LIRISKESIIDVEGEVSLAPTPIEACTQKNVELQVKKVDFVISFCCKDYFIF
jgi:aspartyl/asparaginyl-tRNA synthetase